MKKILGVTVCIAVFFLLLPAIGAEETGDKVPQNDNEVGLTSLPLVGVDKEGAPWPPCKITKIGPISPISGRYQMVSAGHGKIPILLDTATGQTWVLYSSPPTWRPVSYDDSLLPGQDGFCTEK